MRRLWMMPILAACTPAGQDVETPTTDPTDLPDITGAYLATWEPEGDCDEVAEVPVGPLEIAEIADVLVWEFEEAAFDGAIDETFTWAIDGAASVEGWTLSLSGEGLAYISGAHWVLEGDVEMEGAVDADTSCTASGPWSATALGAPE